MSILQIADDLWTGVRRIEDTHPFSLSGEAEEVADGVAFVPAFANVSALATDDGLALVDTGSPPFAQHVHTTLRRWNTTRLHTAVFSHGHIDHVFGVGPFEEEARQQGWAAPRVVAHEAMPARFDRYVLTAGYNEVINQRQFGLPDLRWPREYRYPDETYAVATRLQVGGLDLELTHCRGETDDHTYTWVPERKVLCCGDLFIWASPNAGNPQKVQRYPREWAAGLRTMAGLGAEIMLPGHGVPVMGADRIRQALTDSADLLDHLHDETVAMMNAGARLDEIVHAVRGPQHLLDRPYLRPVYDEPEFVVRNVWRLYGGWWDGDPAHLKPSPAADLATEIASLSGGAGRLAERALEVLAAGDDRLAGHLAELASQAAPGDPAIAGVRAQVFSTRAAHEASTMSQGVFSWAARESAAQAPAD
ncbi:alkyl sulfatase dimerization domain-containing protein [Nocardioides conyzicola]|uniref:Metallo-beta-lactamase domain-containing protein n=1 Tax=Nocardioides conyzicola TaxID=1651781 RepID=A0ABP8Y0B7_9ACTN